MKKRFLSKKSRKGLLSLLVIVTFIPALLVSSSRTSEAACGCTGCWPIDCTIASAFVVSSHVAGRVALRIHIANEFIAHRQWMVDVFFLQQVLPAMMRMTEQLSAVAMQQVMAIGMFLDAKHQLETQRLFQELQNQAHKDYQPSEDFCWFGTNVRSIASSEQMGRYNAMALNARQMSRHLSRANTAGAVSREDDKFARWQQFTDVYCDPQDNNWFTTPNDTGNVGRGLIRACGAGGKGNNKDKNRINIDIDYTRLIDEPRTLDVAMIDQAPSGPALPIGGNNNGDPATSDEQDVIALGNNLFGHEVLSRVKDTYLQNKQYQHLYFALRSVAAKRSVAENSFNAIVGMKSSGTSDTENNEPKTREFLGALMTELGVPDNEVYEIIGVQPSYYAQLELLAKKIYQNPDFYANLYDKPANVARKSVALKAIELMLDRAIFESQLRQEMAMSVLLSSKLRGQFKDVNKELPSGGN